MKFNVDDLVEKGLVVKKTYTEGQYKGLSVLKYHRKVFFNNLWHLDDRLLECRGTVVDSDDNVVVLPFKKVFNHGENGTTVEPNHLVETSEKINGFMVSATMTDRYGLIVSTTGTLDSDYAKLARKWIEKCRTWWFEKGYTFLFEICDNSDPHVVEEEEGAYLIGIRNISTGDLIAEPTLNGIKGLLGDQIKRPFTDIVRFKDIPETKKEGFMVRDPYTQEVLCKLKSKHYLSKKALQRCGKKKANLIFNDTENFRKSLDEEFYGVLNKILDTFTKQEYVDLSEQQRRKWIEEHFENE